MSDFSAILFARPSFIEGMGRILDFGNVLQEYNRSLNAQQADRLALLADWGAVAEDIGAAVEQYEEGGSRVEQTK